MNFPNPQLAALTSGQEFGLKHYMKVHGSALRYFAFSIVKDKSVAEEIVSDSFVKLWTGREKVSTESGIKAFLYISTKNACLDHINLLKNKVVHDYEILDELTSPNEDILTKMIQIELIKLIVEEVEKLPKQQARIFKMTYFEQKETDEICDELGLSSSSIYFARSKALATLKKAFGFKRNPNFQEFTFILFLISDFLIEN
ncbi:sigma-70 family RNA polymerase sigma factor [Sphingobacterium cellulitidis]|uniref:sigma-70 family RNA polymerase sigma factor n=1 Tax=Sphingobacterium cellulitidis TaxID=1768011 RepID=UPI001181C36D|nr:sigma-70 family RNA polymerase sigma factor [Sphingobacterium cellulitidis]